MMNVSNPAQAVRGTGRKNVPVQQKSVQNVHIVIEDISRYKVACTKSVNTVIMASYVHYVIIQGGWISALRAKDMPAKSVTGKGL